MDNHVLHVQSERTLLLPVALNVFLVHVVRNLPMLVVQAPTDVLNVRQERSPQRVVFVNNALWVRSLAVSAHAHALLVHLDTLLSPVVTLVLLVTLVSSPMAMASVKTVH